MRYVDKSNCCAKFDTWVAENKPENWNELPTNLKHTLHLHLWLEQQGLCVYCQQAIPEKKTAQSSAQIRSHIEHIRPRSHSTYSALTFHYHNLSVSCEGFDCTAAGQPKKEFCEHRKANEYDENQFLHPFELQDIEEYFEYDVEGRIFANHLKSDFEQQKANYMIKILALNHKELERLRVTTYSQMLDENLSDINELLDLNVSQLPAFYSMLKFLFLR